MDSPPLKSSETLYYSLEHSSVELANRVGRSLERKKLLLSQVNQHSDLEF